MSQAFTLHLHLYIMISQVCCFVALAAFVQGSCLSSNLGWNQGLGVSGLVGSPASLVNGGLWAGDAALNTGCNAGLYGSAINNGLIGSGIDTGCVGSAINSGFIGSGIGGSCFGSGINTGYIGSAIDASLAGSAGVLVNNAACAQLPAQGPLSGLLPPITLGTVVAPARHQTVTLPSGPAPAPRVISNQCSCSKTVVRDQPIQRRVRIPTNVRVIKTGWVPQTKTINYCAKGLTGNEPAIGCNAVAASPSCAC